MNINEKIDLYAKNAGYKVITSTCEINDSQLLSNDIQPEVFIQEYCNSLRKNNGGIVPVSVGFVQGNRIDPLYNYLDLLICALIDEGFEFVTVSEL